ncbi:hypothetical protein K443DRAFT_35497, partial [Laccaria amethystina LaAM-08-1]
SGRTRASVTIQRLPLISPPQPIGTGLNPMLLPRPTNTQGAKISNTFRTNSEFHGGRFSRGGEEQRARMLRWDLHDGLFVVV